MAGVSAKPLFRAISANPKADSRQRALADFPEIEPVRNDVRRKDDFYPTAQPEATRALLHRDRERLDRCEYVWEPAVGAGHMAREIERHGFRVIGSDTVDRGWPGTIVRSFFDFPVPYAKTIITNPPYDLINARDGKGAWLRHTLSLPHWTYCALLLSWDWPAARKNGLGALLDESPFSYCYLMRWKLDFTGEGSPPQRNAWFVWDREWSGSEPAFRFLDRTDGRQGDMFNA